MASFIRPTLDCALRRVSFSHVETIRFEIPDFALELQVIRSPIAIAHGYEWAIVVYPHLDGHLGNRIISCYLVKMNTQDNEAINVQATFRCNELKKIYISPVVFPGLNPCWGFSSFLHREPALKSCFGETGSLVIYADIQIARVWFPKRIQQRNDWINLYQNASRESSDVAFSIEGTLYFAHMNVLAVQCKGLYDFAKAYHDADDDDDDDTRSIPILSITAPTFKSILEFAYTVKLPCIQNETTARELLVAADLLDCTGLKLYVESFMVEYFLTATNAAALLVFADSYSCALLKESSMKIIAQNRVTAQKSQAWAQVQESEKLFEELFEFLTPASLAKNWTDTLDVTNLRVMLETNDLPLDGSRKVLAERLEKHILNANDSGHFPLFPK